MAITKTEIALHATPQLEALGTFYAPAQGLERQVATHQEWTITETLEEPAANVVTRLQAAVWFAAGKLPDSGTRASNNAYRG